MHLLAEAGAGATQYLIALGGATGLVGAFVALYKLRGDRDSQAVTQAVGAMGTMQELNKSLEQALDRANERSNYYKARCDDLERELEELRQRWGPFPIEET